MLLFHWMNAYCYNKTSFPKYKTTFCKCRIKGNHEVHSRRICRQGNTTSSLREREEGRFVCLAGSGGSSVRASGFKTGVGVGLQAVVQNSYRPGRGGGERGEARKGSWCVREQAVHGQILGRWLLHLGWFAPPSQYNTLVGHKFQEGLWEPSTCPGLGGRYHGQAGLVQGPCPERLRMGCIVLLVL